MTWVESQLNFGVTFYWNWNFLLRLNNGFLSLRLMDWIHPVCTDHTVLINGRFSHFEKWLTQIGWISSVKKIFTTSCSTKIQHYFLFACTKNNKTKSNSYKDCCILKIIICRQTMHYWDFCLPFIMNKLIRGYTSASTSSSWWCVWTSISWTRLNTSPGLAWQKAFNAGTIFLVHQPSTELSWWNIMMFWWIGFRLKWKTFDDCVSLILP